MKIDASIIQAYLSRDNDFKIRNHWIFNKIIDKEYVYEEVSVDESRKIENIFEIFLEVIKDFKPLNLEYWNMIFGEFDDTLISNTVYLIVGSPNPYDAMVREDDFGESCIIFDLYRISKYSEEANEIKKIINNFLTHEIAHILIHKKIKLKDKKDNLELLKYQLLDEGLAHLISYKENIRAVDFETIEMRNHKTDAFKEMKFFINNPQMINVDVLMRSCSGKYWDKFAAISGMFAIKDYYFNSENRGKDIFSNEIDLLIDNTILA